MPWSLFCRQSVSVAAVPLSPSQRCGDRGQRSAAEAAGGGGGPPAAPGAQGLRPTAEGGRTASFPISKLEVETGNETIWTV